jgi:Bacterial Ig-like domain (group 2)/Lactonase, 7-bladed beta-propeller
VGAHLRQIAVISADLGADLRGRRIWRGSEAARPAKLSPFTRADTEFKELRKLKRVLQILPLLAIVGMCSCIGSTLSNLLVSSVKLTPANPTIAVGGTQQMILVETFVDGSTNHESPTNTSWSSTDTSVATISKAGIVTGVGAGTTTVHGSHKDNDATTMVTVTSAADVAITARGDSQTLQVKNLRTGLEITFAANRSRDSIGVTPSGEGMAPSETSVLPGHGPAWLAIDPTGKYLYVVNQTSENVSAFAIDWKTASLYEVVASPFSAGTKPWSVEVDPAGATVSVGHFRSGEISHFRIDPATGALTPNTQ